jgi:hypothetical protein
MMRVAIVILVSLAARSAAAGPVVDVPAGWEMQPKVATEPVIAQLRNMVGTIRADATIYLSAARDVRFSIVSWDTKGDDALAYQTITQFDETVETTSASHFTKHVSTDRRFERDQLVADQIDEAGDKRVHQIRRHGFDRSGVLHTLMVACTGSPASIASCETILHEVHLDIADPAPFPAPRPAPYDLGYLAGRVAVWVIAAAGLLYLLTRKHNRKT